MHEIDLEPGDLDTIQDVHALQYDAFRNQTLRFSLVSSCLCR